MREKCNWCSSFLTVSLQTVNLLGSSNNGMVLVDLLYNALAKNSLGIMSGTLAAESSLLGYKIRLTLKFLIDEVVGDEILGIAVDPLDN